MPQHHWILSFVCDDKPGIVHAISGAIVGCGGNITESQQFASSNGRFFMRLQVQADAARSQFETHLAEVAKRYTMEWQLDDVGRPLRTLVLGSTAKHCVSDLLFRQREGQLPIDVPLVLANHNTLRPIADFYEVPFEHLPVTDAASKQVMERRILELVDEHDLELVVLARYMQILSEDLCAKLAGRAINIHHSFQIGRAHV